MKSGQRSNLGGSAEQGAGSRRLRWWVGVAAGVALLASLFAVTRPDADSIEAKVNEFLEPTRREERNEKGFYQLAARLYDMPEPLPKLGRWIRDDDPDREDPDPEEILELGDEAGPYVLKLLESDPSPGVRAALCDIVIELGGIDPLPVLTNLLILDANIDVRLSAIEAAAEYAPQRAAPALLAELENEANHPAPRHKIISLLPKLGQAHALERLRELVLSSLDAGDDSNVAMSVVAAEALGELGGAEAVKTLRIALDAENQVLASAASMALAKLRDRESLPKLLERLQRGIDEWEQATTNATTQQYSGRSHLDHLDSVFIEALGEFGDATIAPYMIRLLALCQQDWERRSVVTALGQIGDPRALDALVAALKRSRDKWSRSEIITAISQIRGTNTLPALIGILTNYTENASDVVSAISRLSGETATAQLREMFQHSTGRVREAVAHALGMSGYAEALPVLLEAIDSGDDEARQAAAQALGMIADPQAVPVLLTALKDSSSEVRQEAAWALGYVGDPAGAPGLIAALGDADFSVRFTAAFALAGIQDPSAVEPLTGLLADKERRVQIAAACSLTFHSSDAGFDALRTSLRSRSEDWHRFAAIVGLLRLNTPVAREVLARAPAEPKFPYLQQLREAGLADGASPALLTLLREGTDDQRHYAARVLPYFRDATTVAPLREAAHDPSAEVRSAARVAAVQIERQLAARQTSAP